GYGRAEKRQVQQMVKLMLGLPTAPRPHDAADALAVAICHLHSRLPSRLVTSGLPVRGKAAASWRNFRSASETADGLRTKDRPRTKDGLSTKAQGPRTS